MFCFLLKNEMTQLSWVGTFQIGIRLNLVGTEEVIKSELNMGPTFIYSPRQINMKCLLFDTGFYVVLFCELKKIE